MNAQDQNKVLEIINRVVPEVGTVDWKVIIAAVCKEVKVTNAMHVRGVLQYMLKNKMIVKYPSVFVEEYSKSTKFGK